MTAKQKELNKKRKRLEAALQRVQRSLPDDGVLVVSMDTMILMRRTAPTVTTMGGGAMAMELVE